MWGRGKGAAFPTLPGWVAATTSFFPNIQHPAFWPENLGDRFAGPLIFAHVTLVRMVTSWLVHERDGWRRGSEQPLTLCARPAACSSVPLCQGPLLVLLLLLLWLLLLPDLLILLFLLAPPMWPQHP